MSNVRSGSSCRAFLVLLTVLAVSLSITSQAVAALSFASPTTVVTSSNGSSVAIGDLNTDTKPDLATSHALLTNNINVLLGDGAGAFAAAPSSPFNAGASGLNSIAIGDLNTDTKPDLATANINTSNLTVLLGDGAAGFTAAPSSPFAVGGAAASVAIGDVNTDTKPDLITTSLTTNQLVVLLGDGAGGFTAAPSSPFAAGANPIAVRAADVNADTKLDLVASNLSSDNLTVLLGDGAGGFTAAPSSPFAVGTSPGSVAVADVNGDTDVDLVGANYGSGDLTVLLGDGAGGFTAAPSSPFAVGIQPRTVAIGDLDGDTKPDLVSANEASGNLTVLLGDGSGGFAAAPISPLSVGTFPTSVAIGDLNGDTKSDLASTNYGSSSVSVHLNTTPVAPVGTLISGKSINLGDNALPSKKKLNLLSKDVAIDIGGGNGSGDDPTVSGLTVRVESASGGFDDTYTLPASRWSLLGQPGQNKGYKYKDSQLVSGPINTAMIKPSPGPGRTGQIKVTGKGAGLGQETAANPGPVNVEMIFGAEHYCMRFGGMTKYRINTYFKSSNAPVSPGCPA